MEWPHSSEQQTDHCHANNSPDSFEKIKFIRICYNVFAYRKNATMFCVIGSKKYFGTSRFAIIVAGKQQVCVTV